MMAGRNYAALPHEYLEEMRELNDAEFGRLCRALLKYSATGEKEKLSGGERYLLQRVFLQEDRYQASYEDMTNKRAEAGKKGAAKRWNNKAMAKDSKAMANDGIAISANGKNGNTETKTKTETNNITPSPTTARAREDALGRVMSAYLDRLGPISPTGVDELKEYVHRLGEGVCLRALDVASDAGHDKLNWLYIRGILRDKQARGIKSLEDWDKAEEKRKAAKDGKATNAPTAEGGNVKDWGLNVQRL